MKTSKNDLTKMLSLLRDHPPAGPLFTHNDVRRVIENGDAEPASAQRMSRTNRERIIVISALAALLMVGMATMYFTSAEHAPIAQTVIDSQHRTTEPTATDGIGGKLSATPAVAGEDHTDSMQASTTRRKTSKATALGRMIYGSDTTKRSTLGQLVHGADTAGHSVKVQYIIRENNNHAADTTQTPPVDIPGTIVITHTTHDSAETARLSSQARKDTSLNVLGISALELTATELTRLGVEVTPTGLRVVTEDLTANGKTVKQYELIMGACTNSMKVLGDLPADSYSPVAPIAVFSSRIQRDRSFLSYDDRSPILAARHVGLTEVLSADVLDIGSVKHSQTSVQPDPQHISITGKLVPIYIHLDGGTVTFEGTSYRCASDIYLWYYPTKEFLAALPDRYRVPLEEEVNVLADVEANRLNSSEACECLTGGSAFLGICRSSSGAVASATLYPNPAQGATTVGFRLMQPRHVTITLHDITGRYLTTLEGEQGLNVGDYHIALKLDQVQQGTYLVVVRTDSGEQAVQRLIVQ